MKKESIIAAIAATALCFALAGPAFAADLNKDTTSGTTTVTYTVSDSYTVSIPADVAFASDSLSKAGTVSASNVILVDGKTLTVKVASANGYALKCGTGTASSIAYTLTPAGGSALSGTDATTVLTVAAGTTSGSTNLTFATTAQNIASATKAGDHTDTLTFTCSVA